MKYTVTLSGNVEGGAKGKSTYDVEVNKPPASGNCSVFPEEGEPEKTLFTINCTNFEDTQVPLNYKFFQSKAVGGPLAFIDDIFSPGPARSRSQTFYLIKWSERKRLQISFCSEGNGQIRSICRLRDPRDC